MLLLCVKGEKMQHGRGENIKNALLSGYFGFGNAGDEASLAGAIELLGRYGINAHVAFNPRGNFSAFAAMGATYVNRYSASAIKKALAECDALIFAGGNLFQNETSTRSLIYYSAICALAERAGRPIYMLSSGIGRVSGYFGRECARRALSRISFAGLRTDGDIAEWGDSLPCPTRNMPDLALTAKCEPAKRRDFFAIVPTEGSESQRREALRLKSLGLTPVVIPFFIDKDKHAAYRLASELACEVFVSQNTNEIISRLSSTRMILAERLHGAVFSLVAGTPCQLYSKTEKCSRFALEIQKRAKKLGTSCPIMSDGDAPHDEALSGKFDFSALLLDLRRDLSGSLDSLFA